MLILHLFLADPTFFPNRAANIYYRAPSCPTSSTLAKAKDSVKSAISKDNKIGTLGILHPTVLQSFEIGYPCSALEFTLEPFKKEINTVWTSTS